MLIEGKIYRLDRLIPGWVRVLPNPPETTVWMADGSEGRLVETIFSKDRWWAGPDGRPNNHVSSWIKVDENWSFLERIFRK